MTFSGSGAEAFDPQGGSMILSHMMGADRPGGSVQQRDSRNTPRDISRDESRRERSERGAGSRGDKTPTLLPILHQITRHREKDRAGLVHRDYQLQMMFSAPTNPYTRKSLILQTFSDS